MISLQIFPRDDTCWGAGGNLAKPVVTTTSGNTHNANLNGVVPGLAEQLRK